MSKEEIKSSALNGRGMRDYYVYALLFLVLVKIFYLAQFYRQGSFRYFEEAKILLFISLISMVYVITLFFTAMAADYRYYYIVRLLSYFSIPIIFMLRYNIRYISKL